MLDCSLYRSVSSSRPLCAVLSNKLLRCSRAHACRTLAILYCRLLALCGYVAVRLRCLSLAPLHWPRWALAVVASGCGLRRALLPAVTFMQSSCVLFTTMPLARCLRLYGPLRLPHLFRAAVCGLRVSLSGLERFSVQLARYFALALRRVPVTCTRCTYLPL